MRMKNTIGAIALVLLAAACGAQDEPWLEEPEVGIGDGNLISMCAARVSGEPINESGQFTVTLTIKGTDISIAVPTVRGQSAYQVAEKIETKWNEMRAANQELKQYFVTAQETGLLVFNFLTPGNASISTTDPGLKTTPGILNLTATVAPDPDNPNSTHKVTLTWQIPEGAQYDKIRICKGMFRFPNQSPVTTSFVDHLSDVAAKPETITYTLVAEKNGIPSQFVRVTVQNPKAQ